MKNILLLFSIIITVLASSQNVSSDKVSKVGEVKYISSDGKKVLLEKQTGRISRSESIKGEEAKLFFKEPNSTVKIKKSGEIQFFVYLDVNKDIVPEKEIRLVRIKGEKKRRTIRTFIAGPLNKKEEDEYPDFMELSFEKNGAIGYIITFKNPEVGEYAFVIGEINFMSSKNSKNEAIKYQLFSVIE